MREIESLRDIDLNEFPVWRFSGDSTKVTPVKKLPCKNLKSKIVGTWETLKNGDRIRALLGNIDVDDPELAKHFLTLSILRNGIWFHLARYHDFDYETRGPDSLEEFLGLSQDEVFPMSYDITQHLVSGTGHCCGKIERETSNKLSMEELMHLVVPKVHPQTNFLGRLFSISVQWVQGGKLWIAEVSTLTGKVADKYHVAREATMRNLLGTNFGGYLKLIPEKLPKYACLNGTGSVYEYLQGECIGTGYVLPIGGLPGW